MKIIKSLLAIALVATSTVAVAVAGSATDSPMRHDHTIGDGHQVMMDLLKTGKVLSVTPMRTKPKGPEVTKLTGNVQSYEIRIRTPDGKLHAVEFRGMPDSINKR